MKIIGQLVCGPGEADRYLRGTLEEFKRLCDYTIVATCNATQKEKDLIAEYGFEQYEDNREWGREQPNIKTSLLERIITAGADYILVLDADERVPTLGRVALEEIAAHKEAAQLYVVNLWNEPGRYKKSAGFWNVRAYKADASKGTQFLRKPVHCGNAPPFFYSLSAKETYVPHILLHYGLMAPKDRVRKADRYRTYDPNAEHKGRIYYDMLEADTGSAEYVEADVIAKITEFCERL